MLRKSFWAGVWGNLRTHDRNHRLIQSGDRILIAVSGGADSVCLTHYLYLLQQRLRLKLHILHIHHGLRRIDGDRDWEFVQKFAHSLRIPASMERVDVKKIAKEEGRSREEAGRNLRYRSLSKKARQLGFNKIATGHQLNDQAETVLLNLLRGTRWQALGGIPVQRSLGGLQVIRPILCLERSEILQYLRRFHLRHRADKTNFSLKPTRNWIRHVLIPLMETRNPRIQSRLNNLAQQIQKIQ